ncbi:MAG: hypothetical protein WA063_01300 [Minisyncoccia bacterium]
MTETEEKILVGIAAEMINDWSERLIKNKNVSKLGLNPRETKKVILKSIKEACALLLKEMEE